MWKEGQGRVVFWGTTQLIMLVVWVICLILGERFYLTPPLLYLVDGLGVLLIACGLTLAFLGGYELGDQLGAVADENEQDFVTTGIFHKVRHPIYGGLLLSMIGLTLVYASTTALIMVVLIASFFYAKSLSDEVRLIRRFPDYLEYATRTQRFVPFIW
jgi:protein-S-isoprenylcysteine O-methyltransferase Ste14